MTRRDRDTLSRREFLAGGAAFGLAAAGAGGLLSSCGVSATSSAAAPAPAINLPIHTGPWLPSYERVARLYEEETGQRVRLLPTPLEQLFSKQLVDADTQSGGYDIYTVAQNQAAKFWDGGFMSPLGEIESDFRWPSGIMEYNDVCRWDSGTRYFSPDGAAFGLPVVGLIELEFYRGDIYERLDLEGPPETWDEAIESSRKARKKFGKDFYGYLIRGERSGASWNYLSVLRSFGADVFAAPPRDWTVTIDSEAAIAATEKWLELASYGPAGTSNVTQSSIIALMQSGDALHTHITAAAVLPFDDPAQSSLPGKIDTAVVPRSSEGKHAPTGGIWINAIPEHISGERKRRAYDFLSFFMREEAQMEYARASGIVTDERVYESDLVQRKRSQRALQAISESTPYVRRGVDYTFGPEAALALDLRRNEMAAGNMSVRKGHALMAEELKRLAEEAGVTD